MDYNGAKTYLLSKPEAFEDFPFGPDVAVYKVKSKMFATLGVEKGIAQMNLKCDPQEAFALRDMFQAVIPGYHMNKKHWNTVILDSSIPPNEILRMIDCSYCLVVKGLKKVERQHLELQYGVDELYKQTASLLQPD
ncbi:MmcQ/YjbR family DNA-binding protein [Motiliproteus sp. MSK22-1]|uniref:MmcQ/YjbR family DNA-binding protein n=1 Tax=Motiliproteus sp. MSK22-1 TaxID=1897630 RepID=UPI000978B0BA|nr:MmcQ/YjbR family DNA-binding protein [Motiliproteus sp. MSK22-1]OMH39130.1 hypothetical protein BGP75_05370 [Motiliproteus sp. MSK22-1]